MKDLIDRQAALSLAKELKFGDYVTRQIDPYDVQTLPSAQPELAIPISWIEEEIKRLESRKSSFAVLDAVQLKALIKRWESEQNETD